MNRRQMFGAVAAFAAASVFAANYGSAQDKKATEGNKPAEKKVKCLGGNSCKGKSECGVAGGHSCHGQNSCKGKGWVMVASEEDCTKAGGKVDKPKKV